MVKAERDETAADELHPIAKRYEAFMVSAIVGETKGSKGLHGLYPFLG